MNMVFIYLQALFFGDLVQFRALVNFSGLLDMLIYALLSLKYRKSHLCAFFGPYFVSHGLVFGAVNGILNPFPSFSCQ